MSTLVNSDNGKQSLKERWLSQPMAIRGYMGGGAIVMAAIVAYFFAPEHLATAVALYTGSFTVSAAFILEAYLWIVPKLEHRLVKLLATAVGVMALAAATGLSRLAVNEATGQQATHFSSAVGFLVPLSFIPVLAFFLLIGGFVASLPLMVWGLGTAILRRKLSDLDFFVLLSRVFAAFSIVLLVGAAMPSPTRTPAWMKWLAGYSALVLDTEVNQACAEHSEDRVVRVNDGLVIVARQTSDGPQFVRRACPLVAESTELGAPRGGEKGDGSTGAGL
jgi:hypothetical protein